LIELIEIYRIKKAKNAMKGVVKTTSLQKNKIYSDFYFSNIFLKREDQQKVKSFKIRGAYNKINSLSKDKINKGIVCASAGNHAQGFALTCKLQRIKGFVFMPRITPRLKIDKVKEFGGEFVEIILTGNDFYEAYDKSVVFCSQKKLNFIHPFNDYKIIEGQATLFLEILDQTDEKIDTLIIPIGGGGLISGAINVFKQLSKETKIIGVQPAGAPTMKKSINQNKVITLSEIDNFVDGAAVRKVGDLTFDYCKKYLDDIIIIDEDEICKTILDLEKNHNIIAEPAGAMSITALRQVKEEIKGKNVVCIICGGNNDRRRMPEIQLRSNRWINQFLK
tara:strand:+ start:88 stop:1092 length:1005 start_codon:yes stop_codon:yes gene_type:complete